MWVQEALNTERCLGWGEPALRLYGGVGVSLGDCGGYDVIRAGCNTGFARRCPATISKKEIMLLFLVGGMLRDSKMYS